VVEIVASHAVDLTPPEASAWIDNELAQASEALCAGDLDAALDGYIRALGLALQLGPAPTEHVLVKVLGIAHYFARQQETCSLSALGPALVGLVDQVREAGVLPPTAIMGAWAAVAADLGALVGQLGLALSLPPDHRDDLLNAARAYAVLLDDATRQLFSLTPWLDEIRAGA
jgi:hypothetical protein